MDSPPVLHILSRDALSKPIADGDALVIVAQHPVEESLAMLHAPPVLDQQIRAYLSADAAASKGGAGPVLIRCEGAPGARVVLNALASFDPEIDDVRTVSDAAAAGVQRAVSAGARSVVLAVAVAADRRWRLLVEACALAAVGTQWCALEAREAEKRPQSARTISVVGLSVEGAARVRALEAGRWLCRDIGGTEPERMAPMRVADVCQAAFEGSRVRASVERDVSAWPLLASVARASMRVERHRPCVVRLEYVPEGSVERSVFLVGKGVTYDTGGADLKTDGAMAGMSRDKGGAAAVAGAMRAVAELAPKGVKVVGLLGLVRNSVGDDGYVSDEIIQARSGVRVRIGNTDAEGRLVLADLLASALEEAKSSPEPTVISVATLTGHVYRAFGPYVGALENHVARRRGVLRDLCAHGDDWGEVIEWTLPRREDYAFVAARGPAEDVVSSNRLPSVSTPRGHQGPFAFLDIVSGIRRANVALVHLDIGGAALSPPDWQFGRPTGIPVATLTAFACGAGGGAPC